MSEQAASWDMMDCTKQHGNNMANAKQVLDVHVSKGITVAQSNEHMRNWTEKGWKRATDLGNYDPTREHLNFEVVSGGKIRPIDKGRSIPERMAELLHKRGIKDPNEGLEEPRFRTVVNIIFGGSRTRMQELAFGKQEVDFEKGLNILTGETGAGKSILKKVRTIDTLKGRVRLNVGQRMSIHLSAADMVNRILPHSLYIWMS